MGRAAGGGDADLTCNTWMCVHGMVCGMWCGWYIYVIGIILLEEEGKTTRKVFTCIVLTFFWIKNQKIHDRSWLD